MTSSLINYRNIGSSSKVSQNLRIDLISSGLFSRDTMTAKFFTLLEALSIRCSIFQFFSLEECELKKEKGKLDHYIFFV